MNQSRPRRLWREATAMARAPPVPAAATDHRHRRSAVGRSAVWSSARTGSCSKFGDEWQQGARRAEHHDRRIFLVFRRRLYLVLGQFKRDAFALVGDLSEMQRVPVDDDFPAADAEEAAEIDHGRAHLPGAIDDHVDDPPHILIRRAAHIAPQNAMRIRRFDDRDGGRRRGFFRRGLFRRRRGRCFLLLSRRRGVFAGGEAVSSAAQAATAANVATTMARNAN